MIKKIISPLYLFDLIYLSLFWFAGAAIEYILLGVISLIFIAAYATIGVVGFFILMILRNKKAQAYLDMFLLFLAHVFVTFIIGATLVRTASVGVDRWYYGRPDRNLGNQTIIALEKFKNEQGKYPEELEELIPNYIEVFPKSKNGMNFVYNGGGNRYELRYHNKVTGMCYFSGTEIWKDCDFGI